MHGTANETTAVCNFKGKGTSENRLVSLYHAVTGKPRKH